MVLSDSVTSPRRATDPSPGPRRLVKTPGAVHPLPSGEGKDLIPSVCLLPTAFCLLSIAYCLRPIAYFMRPALCGGDVTLMTTPQPPRKRVAVLGGGIAGLAAAYTLARARQAGAPVEELLIEARDRLGGVIRTERVEGFVIEAGPDSFLAEKPEAAALARELGLGDSLIGSNDRQRRTYILHRGRLVPLPDGLMFLVPTRLWPMVTTPLLPLSSKLAMAAELFATRPSSSSKAGLRRIRGQLRAQALRRGHAGKRRGPIARRRLRRGLRSFKRPFGAAALLGDGAEAWQPDSRHTASHAAAPESHRQ